MEVINETRREDEAGEALDRHFIGEDEIDEIPSEEDSDGEGGEGRPSKKGPRDRAFNPWRYAASDKAKALVAEALGNVQRFEDHRAPRKRRRKERDQATFEATVEAVLCDLINHHLLQLPKAIYVSRSKQVLGASDRYKAPALNQRLPDILDKLSTPELEFVRQVKGHQATFGVASRTTIEPGWRLLDRIKQYGIKLEGIGQHPHGETIYLKEPKRDPRTYPKLVDYADTPLTEQFRRQMRIINSWLEQAEIDVDSSALPPGERADPRQRMLRRIFTRGRFSSGGRLFGGFWIPMSKRHREAAILISAEEIVELDFRQMAPRLFYAMKRIQPPEKDLYAIPGYAKQRGGIKKVMNSMLFSTKPITQMPTGVRPMFGKKHRAEDVVDAILGYHPDIADMFHNGLGHQAQFRESEIMVSILLRLIDMEVVALPIHDALLVRESDAGEARQVMLEVFREQTGTAGYVD